jgi:hypothetical protein
VRSTEHTSPKLAARPGDDLNHIYILAQVYKNRVLIHGWATGYDIKQLGAQEHGTIRLHHDMLNDMSLLIHPTIYTAQVQEWERPDYQ